MKYGFYLKESVLLILEKKALSKQKEFHLKKHDSFSVKKNEWHQITNPFSEECKIIEVQYGEETNEDDIERHSYYKDNG